MKIDVVLTNCNGLLVHDDDVVDCGSAAAAAALKY